MGGAIDQVGQWERGLFGVLGSSPASWEVGRSYPSTAPTPTLQDPAGGIPLATQDLGLGFDLGL